MPRLAARFRSSTPGCTMVGVLRFTRRLAASRARGLTISALLLSLGACLGPAAVCAQDTHYPAHALESQLWLPPPGGGNTFIIDRASVPRHMTAVFGLAASYALDPIVRAEGGESSALVGHLAQFEALAALGLFEILELGVAVPVALTHGRSLQDGANELGFGMGDVRLSAKVPLLRGDFSLAARFLAALPTGDTARFLGTGHWIATPSIVAAYDPGPLVIAGEVGYRLRQRRVFADLEQDDELLIALGVAVPIIPELALIADSQLRVGVAGRSFLPNQVPLEVGAGVRIQPTPSVSIEVGGGTGVLAGWGAPLFRGFVSLRIATSEEGPCPHGPEDFDGFEDGDFCADPDNDGDGIPDVVDRCPNDPEDFDGFQDADGCPDADNDADGVLDADDACPNESEDRDGFQDEDGCPEPDNDGDGIPDGLDECPMEPEDLDGYQDEDGCPEPGPDAPSVTVTDTRILISERIYFDFDRDTIRSVSMPLLDEVARVVGELSSTSVIRVDGYTDDEGQETYNVDLSFRRARAVVEYLAARGVPRERLEYRGYGPQNPVAPNDSPEGRALNRRVEFTILQAGEASRDRPRSRRRRGARD